MSERGRKESRPENGRAKQRSTPTVVSNISVGFFTAGTNITKPSLCCKIFFSAQCAEVFVTVENFRSSFDVSWMDEWLTLEKSILPVLLYILLDELAI
jgi:hypothetical protein